MMDILEIEMKWKNILRTGIKNRNAPLRIRNTSRTNIKSILRIRTNGKNKNKSNLGNWNGKRKYLNNYKKKIKSKNILRIRK